MYLGANGYFEVNTNNENARRLKQLAKRNLKSKSTQQKEVNP